jgi:hypothetical protein
LNCRTVRKPRVTTLNAWNFGCAVIEAKLPKFSE